MSQLLSPKQMIKHQRGVIRAKSDFFRTARYGLTLTEHRIVYYAIMRAQMEKRPFTPVTLAIKDFIQICGLKGNSSYSYLKKVTDKLSTRNVSYAYRDESGQINYKQAAWVSSIVYHLRDGSITISPNPDIKELFEGKPYTDSEFYFLVKFKGQYSERMYEIFASFIGLKTLVDLEINDFRERLGLKPGSYTNYSMFKQRVLVPALEEINEFTNMDISLVKEKKVSHGKIDRLFFAISEKEVPKLYDRVAKGEFSEYPNPPLSEVQQTEMLKEFFDDGNELPTDKGVSELIGGKER